MGSTLTRSSPVSIYPLHFEDVDADHSSSDEGGGTTSGGQCCPEVRSDLGSACSTPPDREVCWICHTIEGPWASEVALRQKSQKWSTGPPGSGGISFFRFAFFSPSPSFASATGGKQQQQQQRQQRLVEPLVHDRCLCTGELSFVHASCLDQWVVERRHTTCTVCGAAYHIVSSHPCPLSRGEGSYGNEEAAAHLSSSPVYRRQVMDLYARYAVQCMSLIGAFLCYFLFHVVAEPFLIGTIVVLKVHIWALLQGILSTMTGGQLFNSTDAGSSSWVTDANGAGDAMLLALGRLVVGICRAILHGMISMAARPFFSSPSLAATVEAVNATAGDTAPYLWHLIHEPATLLMDFSMSIPAPFPWLEVMVNGLLLRYIVRVELRSWHFFELGEGGAEATEMERHQRHQRQRHEPAAVRWLHILEDLRDNWTGTHHWPQWKRDLEVMLAIMWNFVGLGCTVFVVALLSSLPVYHEPPLAPLLLEVDHLLDDGEHSQSADGLLGIPRDNDMAGMDFNGVRQHRQFAAASMQSQQWNRRRMSNQVRRRREAQRQLVRSGARRSVVCVRGAQYAFLQREVLRWLHLGAGPLLVGLLAQAATSPWLIWDLSVAGMKMFAIPLPSLLPSVVHGVKCLIGLQDSSDTDACSTAALLSGVGQWIWTFVAACVGHLTITQAVGYWAIGACLLWLVMHFIVNAFWHLILSRRLLREGGLHFFLRHPFDVAAVDAEAAWRYWIQRNRVREAAPWRAESLSWLFDTIFYAVPRALWQLLCRASICILFILVPLSLTIGLHSVGGSAHRWLIAPPTNTSASVTPLLLSTKPLGWRLFKGEQGLSTAIWCASPQRLETTHETAATIASVGPQTVLRSAIALFHDLAAETLPIMEDDISGTPSALACLHLLLQGAIYTIAVLWSAGIYFQQWLWAVTANRLHLTPSFTTAAGDAAAFKNSTCHGASPVYASLLPSLLMLVWCSFYCDSYPFQYLWVKGLLPLVRWWGHEVLRLPLSGSRNVMCNTRQLHRLALWMDSCARRTASTHTRLIQLLPPSSEVTPDEQFTPPALYPDHCRIRRLQNRTTDPRSLSVYIRSVKIARKDVRQRLREGHLQSRASRGRGALHGESVATTTVAGTGRKRNRAECALPSCRADQQRQQPSYRYYRYRGWSLSAVVRYLRARLVCGWHCQRRRSILRRLVNTVSYRLRATVFTVGVVLYTSFYVTCLYAAVFAFVIPCMPVGLLAVGVALIISGALTSLAVAYFATFLLLLFILFLAGNALLVGYLATRRVLQVVQMKPSAVSTVFAAVYGARLVVAPHPSRQARTSKEE